MIAETKHPDSPPCDADAEMSVLGSIMLSVEAFDEVADELFAEQFHVAAHQEIFRTLREMRDEGHEVDPVTLAAALTRRNTLEEVGGLQYVLQVMETVPHAAHVRYYAQIVRERYMRRELKYAAVGIIRDVADESRETEDIAQDAEGKIHAVLEHMAPTEAVEMREVFAQVIDSIGKQITRGIPSGLSDLDELVYGLRPETMIVLAARPSMGKTALAGNIMANVAKAGHAALFFSLEQSKLEISERLLCSESGCDSYRLNKGTVDDVEREMVLLAAETLGRLPIYVDDVPGRTIQQIEAVSRRMRRKQKIALIVIDYLQLIQPVDKKMPREQQVADISRSLKKLARSLKIPVLVLAQLNRGVEQRENKRPKLSDLRESGSIEQDADLVLLLHRPEAFDPEDRPGLAELIVAKHRNGRVGDVNLQFQKSNLTFRDLAKRADDDFRGYRTPQFESDY